VKQSDCPSSPLSIAISTHDSSDPNQVLVVGRFDRNKCGDLIIEAFGRVLTEVLEARLRFMGRDLGCMASDGLSWNLEDFIRDACLVRWRRVA
jgi:hypothetical protein